MVVTGQYQHATMFGGAGHIGVLEHVATAVHTRSFAVPHAEHTVVLRTGKQIHLLRAPDAGRGQILVHPRMKFDVIRVEIFFGFGGGHVDAAQGGPAIAGDEAGGVQAGAHVALALQHRQTDHRLGAGDEGTPALQRVFVVQRDIVARRFGRHRLTGRKGCVHENLRAKNCVLGSAIYVAIASRGALWAS